MSFKMKPSLVSARPVWANQVEFILASVGYAVGLGNVWRFPYICFKSGGGAFFVPYIIMMCLCAIPLVFLEFSLGQYTRLGPLQAILKCCPLMKGVGLATVAVSCVICSYNNTVLTWTLYYLFSSFSDPLPWQHCNATWNVLENCSLSPGNNSHTQSASQQFFDRRMLELTEGIETTGTIRWQLFGLLLLAWFIIYLCIFKGVISTGKVVYFTALFPYVMLLVLLINNIRLPGAVDGISFYLSPRWYRLADVQVWIDATAQIFYSIGVGLGVMISLSSHNKFNNNMLRDALIVSLANSATSIFAGFVIFSAIGYMAHVHGLTVESMAVGGPGLLFVVYPEVFSTMPVPQLWSVLFFVMLLTLGLDTQFGHTELLVTCILDTLDSKRLFLSKRRELVALAVCLLIFLTGIPCITQGGAYIFQLFDHSIGIPLFLTSLLEVVALCWIFGVRRLSIMVKRILGRPPNIFFKVCWWAITPLLIVVVLVSSLIQNAPLRYGKTYRYPAWANSVAWLISLLCVVWIPLGAVHELVQQKGSLLTRLKASVTPRIQVEDASHPCAGENPEQRKQGSELLCTLDSDQPYSLPENASTSSLETSRQEQPMILALHNF